MGYKMPKPLIGILVLVGLISMPLAQASDNRRFTIENTRYLNFNSKETGQQHEVMVVLPDSYSNSPDRKYPVLYFLDAYWDLPLLTGIYGNLHFDNVIPELILVGLSYPSGATYESERLRDFTPTPLRSEGALPAGGAEKYLQFLERQVLPRIEQEFRADPRARALGGVSLGGLFTLYAMYEKPALFGRYIAISPAVEWDNGHFFSVDDKYAKGEKNLDARLFLSYGTEEYKPFRDPIIRFQKQLQKKKYKGLMIHNYKMDGLRHTAVKADGYTRGLMWVWQDMAPTGPSGLEREMRGL